VNPHPEEWLLLHIFGVLLSRAQTALWIPPEQLPKTKSTDSSPSTSTSTRIISISACRWAEPDPSHDADGLGGEEARVAHFVVHYAVEDLLLIVARERRLKETDALEHVLNTRCTSMTSVSLKASIV